jgi:TetR/AcrR family transcriptional repressor of nem operon
MLAKGERKAETRQRIMEAAGTLFRQHGIDAVGVDAIMHQAELTHGGFYAHFPSKEALVAEVSAASLARSRRAMNNQSRGGKRGYGADRRRPPDPAHVAWAEAGCVWQHSGQARRPEGAPRNHRLDPIDAGRARQVPTPTAPRRF